MIILVDQINHSNNLINVPLNNLNQNLLAFSFLLSNNTLFYADGQESNKKLNDLLFKSKYLFEKLHFSSERVSYKLRILLQKIFELNININAAIDQINRDYHKFNKLLIDFGMEVTKIAEQINLKSPLSENINNIIMNLQYHDILKQKMKHIQKISQELIDKLHNVKSTGIKFSNHNQIGECLIYIKEIAELQSSQFIHENKKYQVAIKIIIENLFQIGDDASDITNKILEVVRFNINQQSNIIWQIHSELETKQKDYQVILLNFRELVLELKEFNLIYNDLNVGLMEIEQFVDEFESLSGLFSSQLNNDKSQYIASPLIEQVNHL